LNVRHSKAERHESFQNSVAYRRPDAAARRRHRGVLAALPAAGDSAIRARQHRGLVAQQQQSLVERVKPGMDATEQARLFEDAKAFGLRLDAALDQVAQECQCALINSAALLKASSVAAIPDLSARVAEIVGTAPASPSAQ
jgi:hypothetical protein